MDYKNKYLYGTIAAVVFLVGIFWLTRSTPTEVPVVIEETEEAPVEEVKVVKKAPAPSVPYAQALVTYKDRRIQLNDKCASTPFDPTWNNGTSIMLDNRAGLDRNVSVGTNKFVVKAYDYKIVKLTSDILPTNLMLSCGNQVNSASILLQK